jgi:16S rRNA C1402 N4-methylase RsmH
MSLPEKELNHFQDEVQAQLETFERVAVWPVEKQYYQEAIKCLDNSEGIPNNQVRNCVDRATHPFQAIHQFTNNMIGELQNRVSRCMYTAQDRARDQVAMNPTLTDAQVNDFLAAEVRKCIDEHKDFLPTRLKQFDKNEPHQ